MILLSHCFIQKFQLNSSSSKNAIIFRIFSYIFNWRTHPFDLPFSKLNKDQDLSIYTGSGRRGFHSWVDSESNSVFRVFLSLIRKNNVKTTFPKYSRVKAPSDQEEIWLKDSWVGALLAPSRQDNIMGWQCVHLVWAVFFIF